MMKKLISLIFLMVTALIFTACGGTKENKKETVMKVSIGVGETHYEYTACTLMKDHIEKTTNGSIKVELYPSAQIGNDQEIFEGLPLGIVQMIPCGTDIIANSVKEFGLLSLPYLFDNEKQIDAVVNGEIGDILNSKLEELGYVGLGFGNFGFRHTTNNTRPIESVKDMEGLKIRTMTSPIHLEVFQALGANPTPMAFSELFSALQQGVVDGQENPLMNIYSSKLHEVQKYLTLDGHVFTFVAFVVSKDWFDSLSAEQQNAVREGTEIATKYMKETCISDDELAKEKILEAGVKVTELTNEQKEEFRNTVKPISEKYGNDINPELYKKLLDVIKNN